MGSLTVIRLKKVFVLTLLIIGVSIIYANSTSTENKIHVEVSKGLKTELVKIQYGFYSGNSSSDQTLVEKGLKQTIYSNCQSESFKTICGENDFLITYNGEYYLKIRHFISNNFTDANPEPHEYRFHLKKKNKGIEISLDILGPDGIKQTEQMAKISEAKRNQQGKPIKMN